MPALRSLGLCLTVWTLLLALGLPAQDLETLRRNQKADQERLLEYYDAKARETCPRGADGKVDTRSPEYQKLLNDYKRAHTRLNQTYRKKDPRLDDLRARRPGLTNSGSVPKNVKSDVDWTAETDEAFEAKRREWEARGDTVVVEDHKLVNKTTDETLWRPGVRAGDDALVRDGDAHGTEGGRKKVAGGDNVRDAEGSALDQKKKYLDAKRRGDLKDQAKVVVKGADDTGRTSSTVEEPRKIKDYGDTVTSGTSDLGDDAETREAKQRDLQERLDAEMEQNVAEAERKGRQTDEVRRKLRDSAKKTDTTGDSEWDKARKEANYDGQRSTDEEIADRRRRVEESNRGTREEIARRERELEAERATSGAGDPAEAPDGPEKRPDTESSGRKAAPDAPETAGTKAEPEAAPGTRTVEAPETPKTGRGTAEAPGGKTVVEAEAPKRGLTGPEAPKVKVDTPDGPKVDADTPGAGKRVGDAMDAVDIFSTAEDVKKDLQQGKFADGAKKVGEAVADEVTMGAYSGAKTIKEKKEDMDGADEDVDRANANHRQQHEQDMRLKLRKSGMSTGEINRIKSTQGLEHALRKRGLEVPESPEEIMVVDKGDQAVERIKKQISEEHQGNMRDELVESGAMTREEADKIKTEAGLEHAMKKQGLQVPEKRESEFIEADDTWDERAEQVGEGIKTNVKKAGKFLGEAAEDTSEIAAGLTEDGVAEQALENSVENAKGWLETWEEQRETEAFKGEGKEGMIEYLKKRGASQVGAEKAAEDFYEKGDKRALEKLDDVRRYKDAVEEAKRRGEEIPTEEEYREVSQSLKARKARAAAREKEEAEALKAEEAANAGEWEDDGERETQNGLDEYASKREDARRRKAEDGYGGMEVRSEMEEAERSGDEDRRRAKAERNRGGGDARDIRDESNRVVKQGDADDSWGKHIGDAIEDGLTTGGKTLGQEFGHAASEQVIDDIWEPEKPEPPPLAVSTGALPGGGGGGGDTPSLPSGGPVTSGEAAPPVEVADVPVADGPVPEPGAEVGRVDAPGEPPPEKDPLAGGAASGGAETSGVWHGRCAFCERELVLLHSDSSQNAWGCPMGCYRKDGVIHSRDPAIDTSGKKAASSPGACIRCGGTEKMNRSSRICVACTPPVMNAYAGWLLSGNGRGEEKYFNQLSAGTKAQIERNQRK